MASIRPQVAAAVARYVAALQRQGIEVERVYLYGSQMRGTAGEVSDVDLIVVSPSFVGREPWERAEITGRARFETFRSLGESVEALAKTPEEVASRHPASFLADVLKDAEVVYERPSGGG